MIRKRIYISCIFFLVLIVSCTEKQIKNLQERSPDLLASIAVGWGGQYAGLITSFADILKGEESPSDVAYQQEGATPPYYDQGSQGQYEQQVEQPYYDQESQGQYEQQGGQPYYDQGSQGQYGQPVSNSQNLAVEIDVLKEAYGNGRYFAIPVKNGDTLTQQDNYKVQYYCNMECYIYIAQLDSIGKLVPIIPSDFFAWSNPMTPNSIYSVPEGNKWFFLDENKGMEQIFFIVSKTKRLDIEQLFRKISAENKSLKQQAPITINQPLYTTRGIAGVREGQQQAVTFQNGSQGRYDSTLFESVQADFVLTRWFYHN